MKSGCAFPGELFKGVIPVLPNRAFYEKRAGIAAKRHDCRHDSKGQSQGGADFGKGKCGRRACGDINQLLHLPGNSQVQRDIQYHCGHCQKGCCAVMEEKASGKSPAPLFSVIRIHL